jgi:hypothetical protein
MRRKRFRGNPMVSSHLGLHACEELPSQRRSNHRAKGPARRHTRESACFAGVRRAIIPGRKFATFTFFPRRSPRSTSWWCFARDCVECKDEEEAEQNGLRPKAAFKRKLACH